MLVGDEVDLEWKWRWKKCGCALPAGCGEDEIIDDLGEEDEVRSVMIAAKAKAVTRPRNP